MKEKQGSGSIHDQGTTDMKNKTKADGIRTTKSGAPVKNQSRKGTGTGKQSMQSAQKPYHNTSHGLSLGERFRLRRLKRELDQSSKKKKRPETSQQTIPFTRMYPDGICHVSDNYYTRMVEFYDINYSLLEAEAQADIRMLYREFLDYFEPGIRFQIFFFNRKVSAETLEAQFQIRKREDAFDELREEQVELLRTQAAKGNNGIVKSKFIIFGMNCEDVKEARHKLMTVEKDIIRNMKNVGTAVRHLNGKDRLQILYEYFHQDTMDAFRFSWKEMTSSGSSVMDYIAPSSFDFRYKNRFLTGDMHGCAFYVAILAPRFSDEMIKNLLDIDGNLSMSIHVQTIDILKARKKIKEALSSVQSSKIQEQKKAFQSGYDSDILPPELLASEQGLKQLLDDCNTSNRKLVNATFLITCFGKTKRELELLSQRVSGMIQMADCSLRTLQCLQEQGLMATSPVGCNQTGITRSLDTISLSALVPFCTQELFMRGEAIYMGLNALSNNMILADRKRLRNPNGVILGTPGSGKSFTAKHEMLSCFLMTEDDILVCDPEGEYFPLVQQLHGQIVRLASNSSDYLNPMDIQISHRGDKEALRLKADFLITLVDLIAGEARRLEADERGIVDQCIESIYQDYFRNPVPERMPVLEDLYNALLSHPNPKAGRIADCLFLFVHGSQNYFNHRTNVDFNNRIICFDIRDLGDNLNDLGMLIVQDSVWNRVSRNRERKIATRYYCDEFHLLLRVPRTASYMVQMWKRFRKWGGIPTAMTQNVGDFLKSHEIESILGNSDFICLLNQNAHDQEILMDKLDLARKQMEYVTNAEQGCGLLIFDNVTVPFINKYPTETLSYRLMSTKPEEAIMRE